MSDQLTYPEVVIMDEWDTQRVGPPERPPMSFETAIYVVYALAKRMYDTEKILPDDVVSPADIIRVAEMLKIRKEALDVIEDFIINQCGEE